MSNLLADRPRFTVPAHFYKGARPNWHQSRRHRSVLSLLQRVEGQVLDYGCGYGDLTYAMSQTHAVQGVDVDPERVAFAAEQYAPVPFQLCAPLDLPFADDSFDVVTSIVVIHFVAEPLSYLLEARRVLRTGGHLLIACQNEKVVRNGWRRLFGKPPAQARLWIPPRVELENMLTWSGFQIEADTFFYDPPFDSIRNVGDIFVKAAEQVLSLLSVKSGCGYYVLLAQKV